MMAMSTEARGVRYSSVPSGESLLACGAHFKPESAQEPPIRVVSTAFAKREASLKLGILHVEQHEHILQLS